MNADEFEQGVFDLISKAKMETSEDCSNITLGLVKGLASICGAFNQSSKAMATGIRPEADEEYTKKIADLLFETLDVIVWATNDFGFLNRPEQCQALGNVISRLVGLKMSAIQRDAFVEGTQEELENSGKCISDLIWGLKKAHISAYLAFWFSNYKSVLSDELLPSITEEFAEHSLECDEAKLKEITDRLDSMFPHLKIGKKVR